MTRSVALKYSELFQHLSDPDTLIILDELYQSDDALTVEKLVDKSNSTKSKVLQQLESLERMNIVNQEGYDEVATYQLIDSAMGNKIEEILEMLD